MAAAGVEVPAAVHLGTGRDGVALWGFAAAADELLPHWRRLHAAHPQTGWYPVLLGETWPSELFGALPDAIMDDYGPAAELRAGQKPTPRRCSGPGIRGRA